MASEVVIKGLTVLSYRLFLVDPEPVTRTQGGCQLVFTMLEDAVWAVGGGKPPMSLSI